MAEICPTCDGEGIVRLTRGLFGKCEVCGGTGEVDA